MHAALTTVIILASAGLLDQIIDGISSFVAHYGYPAVFAAAFLEVVFPPIPSEVIFPLVGFTARSGGLGIENAVGMAAVGALGSTAGAILIYYVAKKVGRAAILHYGRYVRLGERDLQKAEKWFEKHGSLAVFSARMVPGIREIISIPAGIGGMNMPRFIAYTFAGSLVWSVALTLIGFYLGGAWQGFADRLSSAFNIIGPAVVVGLGALAAYLHYRHRKKEQA